MTAPFPSYGNEETVGSFNFRRRWANIDWRALSAIDVDRIAQTVDVQTLQQNILHVTFCNVTSEEFHNVDSNFIKLFRLSQLIIEYLLYTQQYLTEQLQVSQQQVSLVTQELEAARSDFTAHASTLKIVKKENRKRRKMIESYQQMLNAGATGLYPCHICHREFISAEFLKGHIDRRHRPPSPPKGPSQQDNQVALNELESKLFDKVQQHLLQSQNEMKQEFLIKESELHQRKVKEFKAWKRQEQERLKEELALYKTTLTTQLQQQQQLNTDMLQKTLEQAQAELQALKESRSQPMDLSVLPQSGQEEQYKEMTQLKDELNAQLHETLKEERKAWKKKLKEKIKKHEEELKQSQNRLEVLEQSLLNQRENHSAFRPLTPVEGRAVVSPIVMLSQGSPIGIVTTAAQSPQPTVTPPPLLSEHSDSGDEHDYNSPTKGEGPEDVKITLHNVLDESLTKRGVDTQTRGLSNEDFDEKMTSLRKEQELRMKTHPTFAQHRINIREQLKQQIQSQYKEPVIIGSPVLIKKPPPMPPRPSVTPPPTTPARLMKPPTVTITPPPSVNKSPLKVNNSITTDDEISELSDDTDDEEYIIPEPIITTSTVSSVAQTFTPIIVSTGTAASVYNTVPYPGSTIISAPALTTGNPVYTTVPITTTTVPNTLPTTITVPTTVPITVPTSVPVPTAVPVTVPISTTTIPPVPVSTSVPVPVLPVINRGVTGKSSSEPPQDNFSDSSEDSIEKLISSSQMFAKASSTPIKSSSNMGLDPTKRPVGGVPVMMVPHPVDVMESDSDTFTISEVTSAPNISVPRQQNMMITAESIPLMNKPNNPPPTTSHPTAIISSHSGLTTVTPDDFDSDISDILELK